MQLGELRSFASRDAREGTQIHANLSPTEAAPIRAESSRENGGDRHVLHAACLLTC